VPWEVVEMALATREEEASGYGVSVAWLLVTA
jgi:hypothetical protein